MYHLHNTTEDLNIQLCTARGRDYQTWIILQELQPDAYYQLVHDLDAARNIFELSPDAPILVKHKTTAGGFWVQYKPLIRIHDSQSLDFEGLDPDDWFKEPPQLLRLETPVLSRKNQERKIFNDLKVAWDKSASIKDFGAYLKEMSEQL